MKEKQKIVPLQELNLTNRFLFDEVMEDPQTQQDVLSIIFGKEIPLLSRSETEKELRVSPLLRSIRMDVYSLDEEGTLYNTEMQQKRKSDLAKRSRYYQALSDVALLEPGVPNYNLLNQSYTIMIMPFDLFGYERYVYTFRPICVEEPECVLEDGATRIFLNTRGKNNQEVSSELVDFLHYLETTTDDVVNQTRSFRIKRIHDRVCKVKASEKVGVKYMQAWEERYFDKQEAREEGLAEGRAEGRAEGESIKLIQMVCKKLQKGKEEKVIADELEENATVIRQIYKAAKPFAPDYDWQKVFDVWKEQELEG